MTDVLNPLQRSFCMSRIRGKNTKPEVLLRRELWRIGLRYKLQEKLFGKPDLVFKSARVAVFVDGCFWHGCPEHAVQPKTNADFWRQKIDGNQKRDDLVTQTLREHGWRVLRFWEHQIKSDLARCVDEIESIVHG